MIIQRKKYLDTLITSIGNGLVKIVTGGRRTGKSFLLFTLFHKYLIENLTDEKHIIELSFDDLRNRKYRNPENLLDYIDSVAVNDGRIYYIILDEIQLVQDFTELILSLMHNKNYEIFVSGSNSKFLSKDVVTEFRGRGQEIKVYPLSFAEFYSAAKLSISEAWKLYYTYGGLPQILQISSEEQKVDYLKSIYELTYLKDVIERNKIQNEKELNQLAQILASSIGSPTNPNRISNTFKSVENISLKSSTIKEYIDDFADSFLLEGSLRYNVKGRKYIGTETKYYFNDLGLRNAVLNFRQIEETHIMENIIYNELRMRGFLVDVGIVETWKKENEKNLRVNLEVDFVVNKGNLRYYIQSALSISDESKHEQETASLKKINDAFKRIIIVKDDIKSYYDDDGFLNIGLFEFLLNSQGIEQ